MATLRTALVGFGYAGQTFHAPLIAATPGLALSAIVSGNAEKVRSYWPAVPVLSNIDTALADPALDLIVIATPNHTHADLARRALNAGKHVVVDKPFTVTLDEARDLAALEAQSAGLLSVFHNRRWDADFLVLADLVRQGVLGRLTHFESHFDRFRPVMRDRWREQASVPGAGLWHDLGPHLIDQVLCLFGRPATIFADIITQRRGNGAPDYFHAILGYETGLRAVLHGSMVTPDSRLRFAAHGDGGSFVKYGLDHQEEMLKAGRIPGCAGWGNDPSPARLTRIMDGAVVQEDVMALTGDYRCFYTAFQAAVRQGARNPVTAQEAIAVIELIEAGYDSARQQRVIKL
ncbi:oxidoreductase [Niveispirillum lacus]|uniref:Oxidoreductase n=1 Tax=Niveispirillum lacus TaxID=1981099 RepID=A0A255Z848_9PROT|nr:oxidoreductase [Niveispirillum lacus]OYQ37727.1 oxidoreductase [Niveispirillum lacus]